MMAKVDLRKLKDQATAAIEKKQYAKAAELYLQIAEGEAGDPDWRQRAGEAFRKVPDPAQAVAQLERAAEGYAKNGFLLKAIAVCKVVLQLDARHTQTQAMLTGLYATREGRVPSVKSPLPPRSTPHAPTSPPAMPPPARPVTRGRDETRFGLVEDRAMVSIDDRPTLPLAVPMTPPLDALPLHEVLGGRRSAQFAVADLDDAAAEPAAYEISIDESQDELALADAIPVASAPRSHSPSGELDFSKLMDDLPTARLPPVLPKIPLLSSLGADDLRQVIDRVEMRDYQAGDTITRQGAEGRSLYVIVRGRVQVISDGPPRRELAALGEGAFFGELALLTNFPRSATVTAAEPTQLLEISRELVTDIVQRSPEVLKLLLRFFRDRLLDRLLGSSALFASFAPDDARGLAARFIFLELEPGMRVIVEGERAPGLFLLLCGEARVVRGNSDVAALQPGDVFGEMSLLTRGPASATIETRTKCWALELPRERFQEIMLSYPQLLAYVSELADRRSQQNLAGPESRVDFL